MSSFLAVLNRVQSDYAFYVRVQSEPQSALAEYHLDPEERAVLSDPKLLADALEHAVPWRLVITISGRHDWVNRTKTKQTRAEHTQVVEQAAGLVRAAGNAADRRAAALRLVQLVG